MSNGIWERFNDIASTDEVADAQAQFVPIEVGTYSMKLEELKADETKDGLPTIKGRFRTDTNKIVYYNQTLQNLNYPDMTATNIARAVDFISVLLNQTVKFKNLGDFADIIDSVPVGGFHTVEVTFGKKDVDHKFPVLTGVKREDFDMGDLSDLPFSVD